MKKRGAGRKKLTEKLVVHRLAELIDSSEEAVSIKAIDICLKHFPEIVSQKRLKSEDGVSSIELVGRSGSEETVDEDQGRDS